MEQEVKENEEVPKRKAKEKFNKMIIVNIITIIALVAITFIKNIPSDTVTQSGLDAQSALQLKPSMQATYPMMKLVFGIVKLMGCLLMVLQTLKISIDLVYLSSPFIRNILGGSEDGQKKEESISFVSDLAKKEAEQDGSIKDYVVKSIPTFVLVLIIALFAMTDMSTIVSMMVGEMTNLVTGLE